jgi:hypothetical protein
VRAVKNAYLEQMFLNGINYRFKEGQKLLQDDEQKGHPSTSRTQESTEIIEKCLAGDRTLSVQILEEMTGFSKETVLTVLFEDLKSTKSACSFVPPLVTPHQMR